MTAIRLIPALLLGCALPGLAHGTTADASDKTVLADRTAADTAERAGDLPSAEKSLRDAVALAADDPWARRDLAHVLIAEGHSRDAQPLLAALSADDRPESLYAGALVAAELGRAADAAALLARIPLAARTPAMQEFTRRNAIELRIAEARSFVAAGQLIQASALLRALATQVQARADLAVELAGVEEARGHPLAALTLLREGRKLRLAERHTGTPDVDPLLAEIDREIARLDEATAPRLTSSVLWDRHGGAPGLGRLTTITAPVKLSTIAGTGRVRINSALIALDSGAPDATALAQVGHNPEAAIPRALTDTYRAGAEAMIGWTGDVVSGEFGLTSVGLSGSHAIWRLAASPKIAPNLMASGWFERKPVTQSLLSYAGLRDPVSGEIWGQAMRTGGGAGLDWNRGGSGLYANLRYGHTDGINLRGNSAVEANLGGYRNLVQHGALTLSAGLDLDLQSFAHNENAYSFGMGGYFSPQRLVSLGAPLHLRFETDAWDVKAGLTPGWQAYRQSATAVFPDDPVAQEALAPGLDQIAASRNSGAAVSAQGSAWRRIAPAIRVGGEGSFDNFGSYEELRAMLGVRWSFGHAQ